MKREEGGSEGKKEGIKKCLGLTALICVFIFRATETQPKTQLVSSQPLALSHAESYQVDLTPILFMPAP